MYLSNWCSIVVKEKCYNITCVELSTKVVYHSVLGKYDHMSTLPNNKEPRIRKYPRIVFKQIENTRNYFSRGHQVKREVKTGMANIKQDPQKESLGIAKKNTIIRIAIRAIGLSSEKWLRPI